MIHGVNLFLGLFNNLAIFIVLITIYSFLNGRFTDRRSILRQATVGLSFGCIALICMQVKIPVSEGVVVDQRNAIVILSAAFGGPFAGLISAVIAGMYRAYLGGVGVVGGCLGLLLSAAAGTIIHFNRSRIDSVPKAVIVALGATVFILPGFLPIVSLSHGLMLMRAMALPYGFAIFLGVLLTGLLLALEEYRYDMKNELSRSEKRYRELFENLIDVSIRSDVNNVITIISPSCEKMFGYSPSEVVGTAISDYFINPSSQSALIDDLYRTGQLNNYEMESRRKDGSIIWVSINARKLIDVRGEAIGFEATIRDISEMKAALQEKERLREKLGQIQKMESIGTLAGGIAHDFNNALGGIIGGVELLRGDSISSTQRDKFINIVLSSADKAGELTKKLLTFSRKGSKEIRVVDMADIINDSILILRRTIDKRITVTSEFLTDDTRVKGDDALLQNVFLNFGINAGHAMPDGGTLAFTVDTTELDRSYCDNSSFKLTCGKYLRISVADTGCGIPPEIVSQIFEPFFTTKEAGKGTGLGLAAVYGTIQDHNGEVTVASKVGKGTEFHVLLPVTKEATVVLGAKSDVPKGSGTILLIDDEDLIRSTVATMLGSLGYDVLTAEDGKVGLSVFEKHRNEIDLVILDMIMPVMSGHETFSVIHKADSSLPVVIASGFALDEEMKKLCSNGIAAFLKKPFRRHELAETIARFLNPRKQA